MHLHKYEIVGEQIAKNVTFGLTMVPIIRTVKKCKRCGKYKIIPLTFGGKC